MKIIRKITDFLRWLLMLLGFIQKKPPVSTTDTTTDSDNKQNQDTKNTRHNEKND